MGICSVAVTPLVVRSPCGVRTERGREPRSTCFYRDVLMNNSCCPFLIWQVVAKRDLIGQIFSSWPMKQSVLSLVVLHVTWAKQLTWLHHFDVSFSKMSYMPELTFNIDNGYLEGLVRGFKGGILKQADYLNLVQCETLEGTFRFDQLGLLVTLSPLPQSAALIHTGRLSCYRLGFHSR